MNKRKRIETIAKQKKKVCVFATTNEDVNKTLKTIITNPEGLGATIVPDSNQADIVIARTLTPEKRDELKDKNIEIFSPSDMLLFWGIQAKEKDVKAAIGKCVDKCIENCVDIVQKTNTLNQEEQTTAPAWFKKFDEENRAFQKNTAKKQNKRLETINATLEALLTDLNRPVNLSLVSNPLLYRPQQSNTGNTGASSTG
eukprot:TRINITY_DN3090_c0_g1_i1.p1 TRINITY_DN3090_c0_g1~~TRINITY_DN3090_c0_g1_i1.p1  ORF type:complete len:225 (-),score=30.39 TRINITY_DN3090_c0_g1_i1:109-705(-)